MPRGTLGRLPTLSSIGKSQNVDEEDPPEGSDDADDIYFRRRDDSDDYFYEPTHADETARALARTFKLLSPGQHVCKRAAQHLSTIGGEGGGPGGSFWHCRQAVTPGRQYAELRALLEARAKLRLVRDYTSRINAAAMYVRDLEMVAQEELATWHQIGHDSLDGSPHTKLECLSAMCEDLRVHMNHWNSIKQLAHTDRWLRPLLPALCLQMDAVRQKLFQLRDHAIWWIDRLIRVGLQVLAHCDLERLSQDALWSITRGLEDFNNIVVAVRFENLQQNISVSSFFPNHCSADPLGSAYPAPSRTPGRRMAPPGVVPPQYPMGLSCSQAAVVMNSYRNLGESIKPIPFIRVLNILSSERSKYAAIMAHRIFTTNDEFAGLTQCRLAPYVWNDPAAGPPAPAPPNGSAPGGGGVGGSGGAASSVNTSDYHSGSASAAGSGNSRFIVGNMRVPDLAKEMSSLSEFAQREFDFASKFLHIVCSSTNLLKKASSAQQQQQQQQQRARTSPATAAAPHSAELDVAGGIDCSGGGGGGGGRADPKRKSVSWGDTVEHCVKQQLTAKYMDLVWQFCGSHLYEFFHEPIWGGLDCVDGQLGHVAVCPDTVIVLVVRMMQQVCLTAKEGTPQGALSALTSISRRLEACTAWAAWDIGICAALASQSTDKCQPTPLADDDYSTVTAKRLRDAYQPLVHVLRLLDVPPTSEDSQRASVNGAVLAVPRGPSLALLIPSLQRLLVTSDLAARWCACKSHEFLALWSLSHFLLVTQSDRKILSDEVKRSVTLAQRLCSAGCHGNTQIEAQMQMQLSQLLLHLTSVNGHMQTSASIVIKGFSLKCAEQAREFFEEAMPLTKVWRKKGVRELPTEPQQYVTQAMETLLAPVVHGVSQLRVTAQLSAVSMATVAVCDAWTSHILNQKIRFSIYGAHQLELDFRYVRTWLHGAIQHPEVRQSVLSLDVFKYLDGIIGLLKRQPKGRASSRPPPPRAQHSTDDNSVDAGSTSLASAPTPADSSCDVMERCHARSADGSVHDGGGGHDISTSEGGDSAPYRVPNMEQWLALRVHGGARSWPKLPSCFNSGEP